MAKEKKDKKKEKQEMEYINGLINKVSAAQQKFATYTQEQVDEIFRRVALKASSLRIPLAKMAVEETGMGIAEDKVIKNHFASEYIYNKFKNAATQIITTTQYLPVVQEETSTNTTGSTTTSTTATSTTTTETETTTTSTTTETTTTSTTTETTTTSTTETTTTSTTTETTTS